MNGLVQSVRHTLIEFCTEFIAHPYLCYTEHGLHALCFSRLYEALPEQSRYGDFNGQRVCTIQKEYPTAHHLGKSKRQHWDLAVIKSPLVATPRTNAFDYQPLGVAIEFGLNCTYAHLTDDIERLCHAKSNVDGRFVVHLYRLSPAINRISGRDWAPESNMICTKNSVQLALVQRLDVEVFYGIVDSTGVNVSGLWSITANAEERLV